MYKETKFVEIEETELIGGHIVIILFIVIKTLGFDSLAAILKLCYLQRSQKT